MLDARPSICITPISKRFWRKACEIPRVKWRPASAEMSPACTPARSFSSSMNGESDVFHRPDPISFAPTSWHLVRMCRSRRSVRRRNQRRLIECLYVCREVLRACTFQIGEHDDGQMLFGNRGAERRCPPAIRHDLVRTKLCSATVQHIHGKTSVAQGKNALLTIGQSVRLSHFCEGGRF